MNSIEYYTELLWRNWTRWEVYGGRWEPHLLRFLSDFWPCIDTGVGSVLGTPSQLRLGQLPLAVLLHSLGLQLRDAAMLGAEDLWRVGLLSHLRGGGLLMLLRVSLCRGQEGRGSRRVSGRGHHRENPGGRVSLGCWGKEQ